MAQWLAAPQQRGLRRAFAVWIRRVLFARRAPGLELPEVHDLQEVRTMIEERVIDWEREAEARGRERGHYEGREEGRSEGRVEGQAEGRVAGEAAVLLRQIAQRFGAQAAADVRARVEQADAATLLSWSERILTAERVEEIFG